MRELFAEFGAGEIVDFAVGLVGSWRHFLFFCFLLWVGFGVGLRLGWCCVVVGWWVVVVLWFWVLSDRAAAMLSCREADDTLMKKERKKKRRPRQPDAHIYPTRYYSKFI